MSVLLIGLASGASAAESQADPRVPRSLLRTGQLDALSAWVEARRSTGAAFASFRSLTGDETTALRAWVAAEPNSSIATLALAERELAMAWEPRDGDTPANRMVLREHAQEAVALSEGVRRRDPDSREADRIQLDAARLLGDSLLAERAWSRGFAASPADPELWGALLEARSRRWGGSYAQLEAAAGSAQLHVAAEPRLREMLARIPADRARDLRDAGKFAAAIEQWDLALSHGDQAWLLSERAWTKFQAGDPLGALAGLERVVHLAPFDADAHHRRAHVLMALERYAVAAEAAALSVDLAPSRDHFAWVQQSAAAKARVAAGARALARQSLIAGFSQFARSWWLESVLAGLFALASLYSSMRLARWRSARANSSGAGALARSRMRLRSDRVRPAIATLERDE